MSESPQKPLDPPMVPFAVAGIVAFGIAWLAVTLADGPDNWQLIAAGGFLWGFAGLATMIVHDRNRAKRRSAS